MLTGKLHESKVQTFKKRYSMDEFSWIDEIFLKLLQVLFRDDSLWVPEQCMESLVVQSSLSIPGQTSSFKNRWVFSPSIRLALAGPP